MKTDQYGQMIFSESDLVDLIMQGNDISEYQQVIVDQSVDLEQIVNVVNNPDALLTWYNECETDLSVEEFDQKNQQKWYMPESYLTLDIAEHVLSLCKTPEQLQRAGQELLLYQERNLFDLLRYLKYLVDVMTENCIIWGVGRGSSVASYVLYLLGVHRIDSLYYDLDPEEFLR
jgi:DNA polymerase III alpha subunit